MSNSKATDLRPSLHFFLKTSGADETAPSVEKEDDEEYGDEASSSMSMENSQAQTAIDITAQFVYERLKPKVVTNLVLISLVRFFVLEQFVRTA